MIEQKLIDRFESRYIPEPNSGCWLWIGAFSGQRQYGVIYNGEKNEYAHRFSYRLHKGEIPQDFQVDHKCSVACCVNPDHLDAVTIQENLRRTYERGRHSYGNPHANKTHCPYGHSYDGENLYIRPNGNRECRTCLRERMLQRNRRIKGLPLDLPKQDGKSKTHCLRDHPFVGENLRVWRGKRFCRECDKIRYENRKNRS